MPPLCIIADPGHEVPAAHLARVLGAPLRRHPAADDVMALHLGACGLSLQDLTRTRERPFRVDFGAPGADYRRRRGGGVRQTLARAVGIRPGWRPGVLDATAGWGRDAFVLAALGCEVTLIERHAVIAALLRDGLARGAQAADTAPVVARMLLVEGEAIEYLTSLTPSAAPDVVYLDPMYPTTASQAAVKKDTRLLRLLASEGTSDASALVARPAADGVTAADSSPADALLEAALARARERVAVKRPRGAAPLAGPRPDMALRSPATRYDVYICRRRGTP